MGFLSKKICQGRVVFSQRELFCFGKALFANKTRKQTLVKDFETSFARYVGVKHAVAVSCGKMALSLGLSGLGAREGDEIIIPAYTVPEVVEVIISLKLIPVFVDISLEDGTMDAELIEGKISKNTRFILATHMYGNPCDLDKVLEIAEKYGLIVIEDAAQSCGGEYRGKKTGSFGRIGYFSFGLIKNLNTLGGGMIVTNDDNLIPELRRQMENFSAVSKIKLCRRLLNAGLLSFFTHPLIFSIFVYPLFYLGLNKWKNKLSSLIKSKKLDARALAGIRVGYSPEQAALGLCQLRGLDGLNTRKIMKAKLLNEKLSGIKELGVFKEQNKGRNIYLNYVIRVRERKKLMGFLFDHGVDIIPGFVINCAARPDFAKFYSDCPKSAVLEKENLYLPIYEPLTSEDVSRIGELIEKYFKGHVHG